MQPLFAVTLNPSGELDTIAQASQVALYRRSQGRWQQAGVIPFQAAATPAALHAGIRTLVAALGDCRVLLSRTIGGIAYQALTQRGFALFEVARLDEATLDGVWADLEAAADAPQPEAPTAPFSPLGDGHYVLDLARLQAAHPEISSKKAFRAFLESESFLTFTLLCDHVPPWAEDTARQRKLALQTEPMPEGGVKAVFTAAKP